MKTITEQQQRIKMLTTIVEGIDMIYNQHSYRKTGKTIAFEYVRGFAMGYSTAKDHTKDSLDTIVYVALLRGSDTLREELVRGIELLSNSIHEQQQLEKEIG